MNFSEDSVFDWTSKIIFIQQGSTIVVFMSVHNILTKFLSWM